MTTTALARSASSPLWLAFACAPIAAIAIAMIPR
jgi:hypothetical protein